ncbi:MAG TPA: BTAD domain-containing putative transcriptional regulator [Gemmatimonadaceae bacterium]|nr:BTAD domain-containing putative transcriptional regulator [Gemmatimonadaceae bacterium]
MSQPAVRPAPAPIVASLPPTLTSFVGREREVAAVADVLAVARLVTLTGAGGSGKTRLAAEVARSVASRFPAGVAWIELAAITDPALVVGHIAAALGIESTGRPAADALRDGLREASRSGELLIVLDNCEHVIDACAAIVQATLAACERVRLLTTSREALGVAGERAWLVPVLSLPTNDDDSLDAIIDSEAVRLFVDRAQAASATFRLTAANATVVARLCRRLDGLPLAIELAAARVRALTPDQMLARLEDGLRVLSSTRRGAVPRHRTLRDAIDWSYHLLDGAERLMLQRLSVFAGEFSLDAAEAVCADDVVLEDEVLDLLAALVDKSLVVVRDQTDEARYRLLETIRQYAAEQLEASGHGNATRERHAQFYASLVRQAEPHFITPDRPRWVERIQRELDDLRLVLSWSRVHAPALHVELVGRLGWFWYSSGLWTEGRRWVEDAFTLHEAQSADARRAALLFAGGVISSLQGQGAIAREWLEESAAIARSLGDQTLEAYANGYLGIAVGQEGSLAAERYARAALPWFEQVGDLYGKRLALVVLATMRMKEGDLANASVAAEEAVRVAYAYGLGRELGIALQVLGTVKLHQRKLDAAAGTLGEALRALRGDPQAFWLARALELLGIIECARGHPLEALRLFGAAEARRERMGALMFQLDRERLAPHVEAARAAVGERAFAEAWRQGGDLPFEEVVDAAITGASSTRASEPVTNHAQSASGVPSPVLRVAALGPLEIERDGVLVPHSAWKYARPRELFLFLLAHPEGRSREQVGLAFWPDASAAQVKNNFHVMLHHLRRALGRADLVVFENDRYRVNWALGVELDVPRFERDVTAARRALRANPASAEAAERLQSALALYRGDFLGGENAGDWHLEIRDHLRRVWVDGLLALGSYYVAAGAFGDAVDAYRTVVRADELNEEAHRQLMAALARAGHRGEALRHYDRFVEQLENELGARPERKTLSLYEQLKRAEPV